MEPPYRHPAPGRRTRRLGGVVVLLTAALLSGSVAGGGAADALPPDRGDAVVRTDAGAVRGRVDSTARVFQGIPYAAPPEGDLRWASPQPAEPWRGVRDATEPGNRCAQAKGLVDEASTDEDCLFLNVTTPRHTGKRRLPVMVWIHGNGFISGAASLYGAKRLAAEGDVVVVSPNYRLGIFGFLTHPALDHGKARNLSGNFGLEDQQAALRWVRRNAAAFGGDPGNVTIFGESAGGTSVCAQLAAPSSAGLFHRAIVQSAQCTGAKWSPGPATWFPLPRADRRKHGLKVAAELGCADPATAATCLRDVDPGELTKWSDIGVGSGPTVGGGFLPLSPERAFATGRFNRVPVMQGTTRDEHHLFTAAIEAATEQETTPESYREQLAALFRPADLRRVLARYPVAGFHSAGEALSTVVTDWAWGCPAQDRDRALAAHTAVYAYEFADDTAPWFRSLRKPNFPTGAFHGAELQYLFDDEQLPGPQTPAQQRLATTMISYWSRFAAAGNPNSSGRPRWMPFQGDDGVQSLATTTIGQTDRDAEHRCAFWRTIDS
ncbi:carboxylesterase/lipase family protein [Actinomadura sp. NEAU-AAG7]|uniref:carboxylesterase/lipase family protein n=1 Tax=Actinomadura sp. NEAU-AAG7 TaxID=2839640 RepID=UPI001BE4BDB2|nr:carboxylesterase family protein [Actinomadura sp. NEAU-AAG7]MBT2208221.1 carboxylesterase family protein [Actinomadura sp. NEAU-AAG7]